MDFGDLFGPKARKTQTAAFLETEEVKEEVLDILTIEYSIDYDINEADLIIKAKLKTYQAREKELRTQIRKLDKDLDNARTVVLIRRLESDLKLLEQELADITQTNTLQKYIQETKNILRDFAELPETRKVIDLMDTQAFKLTANENLKKELIDSYLEIAKKYIKLRVDKRLPSPEKRMIGQVCLSCLQVITTNIHDSQGHLICQCGVENKVTRIETSSGKEYNVWNNLLKSIKRDACTQTINFNVDVLLEKLDEYFVSIGKPTSKYYKNIPLNQYGRKAGTHQDTIIKALEALGYNNHYKDYLFICHQFFGWERLDVLKHVDKIKEHFLATQLVWDTKMTDAEKGRSSSLPLEYRKLQQYLLIYEYLRQLRKQESKKQQPGTSKTEDDEDSAEDSDDDILCPFDKTHFNIAKKQSSVQEYDRIWQIMCERANHPEIKFQAIA